MQTSTRCINKVFDTVDTFPFDILQYVRPCRGANGHPKNHAKKYADIIATFDIETTSCWIREDEIITYEKGLTNEYWNNLEPLALCYLWQCSVDDVVYYGRELESFLLLLKGYLLYHSY